MFMTSVGNSGSSLGSVPRTSVQSIKLKSSRPSLFPSIRRRNLKIFAAEDEGVYYLLAVWTPEQDSSRTKSLAVEHRPDIALGLFFISIIVMAFNSCRRMW